MISVAHSPDSDDYFLFWAIVEKRIDCEGLAFSFEQFDTATLNQLAAEGRYDVVAISTGAFPACRDNYLILPHGASVGRNYGPVVVAKSSMSIADLNSASIAIPGETTTAARVLKLIAPDARTVELPIKPYRLVFDALHKDKVDAALLIHEGQILYQNEGFRLVVDLGSWWETEFHLPLPLGINVIHKRLGDDTIQKASRVIYRSISYGIEHQGEALDYLIASNQERADSLSSREVLKRYLSMYANDDTLTLSPACLFAIEILLSNPPAKFEVTNHLVSL